jgi:hypothetical protein
MNGPTLITSTQQLRGPIRKTQHYCLSCVRDDHLMPTRLASLNGVRDPFLN